jgi:hypothetical protein
MGGRYHYLDSIRFITLHVVRSQKSYAFIACDDRQYTQVSCRQRELCHSAFAVAKRYIRYVRGQQQGRQEYGERAVKEEIPAYTIPDLTSD